MNTSLPIDSDERKKIPLLGGLFGYFAAALVGVAKHSAVSNEKHNPGQPLHWSFDKSNDHAECVQRHLLDLQELLVYATRSYALGHKLYEKDLLAEADALAWRALALSQTLHMKFGEAPLPFNAKRSVGVKLGEGYLSPRCIVCQEQVCVCGLPGRGGMKPADTRSVEELSDREWFAELDRHEEVLPK